MKLSKLFLLLAVLALAFSMSMVVACGDDDDDDDDDDDLIEDDDDEVDDDDDAGCGPEELCDYAVECGYYTDASECTPWYESNACTDMDAYIDCNCDCMDTETDCDGWIDCGTVCFNNLC